MDEGWFEPEPQWIQDVLERPDIAARPDVGSAPSAAPAPGRRRPSGRAVVAAVTAGLLLLSSGVAIGWGLTSHRRPSAATAQAPQRPIRAVQPNTGGSSSSSGATVSAVAAKVIPGVVDIRTTIASNPFTGATSAPRAEAAGTGMVVTSNGEILTNNHVIEGASKIEVTFQNRSGTYAAHVLGVNPSADVALIQVDGLTGLPTVTLADSSSVSVGQQVVAIGNALGRGGAPSVTSGTVQAVGRDIAVNDDRGGVERLSNMIETNAHIQPGDSGGPLVNTSGQVIGMITAGSRSFGFQVGSGTGFAIPSSSALHVVNAVRAGHGGPSLVIGEAGYLGISAADASSAAGAQLGASASSGALVTQVFPGTPAARLGLAQGDVITAVDGRRVTSSQSLGGVLHSHGPGDQIRLTWVDPSGAHSGLVTLVSGPAV